MIFFKRHLETSNLQNSIFFPGFELKFQFLSQLFKHIPGIFQAWQSKWQNSRFSRMVTLITRVKVLFVWSVKLWLTFQYTMWKHHIHMLLYMVAARCVFGAWYYSNCMTSNTLVICICKIIYDPIAIGKIKQWTYYFHMWTGLLNNG